MTRIPEQPFQVQVPISTGIATVSLPQSVTHDDITKLADVLRLLPVSPSRTHYEVAERVDRWADEAERGNEPLVARTLGNLAHEIREEAPNV